MSRLILCLFLFAATCGAQVVTAGSRKLMLFGGRDHRVYLGCLSCSAYQSDSVLNQYGEYGSRYSGQSIFDSFGDFGGRFNSDSPCNPFASNPPVVVDEDGNYYGELTVSVYRPRRARALVGWINGVCQAE